MSKATEKLQAAMSRAMTVRPKVGGFPYFAEVFRQAGVARQPVVSAGVSEHRT